MINFERHHDPLKALRMGRRQKRLFKDIKEVVQWILLFPEECTEGIVNNWFGIGKNGEYFFNFDKGIFNIESFDLFGKLPIVKWLKNNIHWEQWPEDSIGLKECKEIIDRAEMLIMKIYQEKVGDYQSKILNELKEKYDVKN